MGLRTWGGGRVSWDEVREWRGHIYTLPNVKQIASGKQPHSTGRSARWFAIPREVGWGVWEGGSWGRGCGDVCVHVADSLCCMTETNTVL